MNLPPGVLHIITRYIYTNQGEIIIVFIYFSYSLIKSIKDELDYRNMHLLRVIETERAVKWKLQEFIEEQRKQLASLRMEVYSEQCLIKLDFKTMRNAFGKIANNLFTK